MAVKDSGGFDDVPPCGSENRRWQRRGRLRQTTWGFACLAAAGIAGCGFAERAARSASVELVSGLSTAVRRHPDPELVEDGLPFALLLLDGMLVDAPDDPELLRAATESYTIYTQSFLSEPESGASPEASQRTVDSWGRAKSYGLRLLSLRAFFAEALDADFEVFETAVLEFSSEDVADLHAAASAWLGWIIAASDSMEALADLPRALALAERALQLDESYADGTMHLVFAVFFTVQPRGAGQDLDRARHHFERAIELAGPSRLMPRVLFAEYFGAATLDEELFRERLEAVVDTDVKRFPENRFENELALRRARTLLTNAEEIF